ncbi:hypothetical protein Tco_0949649 [Tanacetum coccineum]
MQTLNVGLNYMPLNRQVKLKSTPIRSLDILGHSRVAAWKKGEVYGKHVERLTPDETEARSDWWISSKAYFDRRIGQAERVPRHMPAHSATPYWQPAIPSHPGTYNWQSSIPSHMGNPNLQSPIGRHYDAAGLFDQREQPPFTVLPKKRGNKTKNNVKKSNLSPLNLGNALDDDNEGGDDVMFLGAQFTGNYLVYENVDVSKVRRENYVNYMDFLNRPKNAPWTVAYTNTIRVNPENQRFLIETDQHAIGTLDGSTRPCLCPYMLEEIIGSRV